MKVTKDTSWANVYYTVLQCEVGVSGLKATDFFLEWQVTVSKDLISP